MYLIWKLSHVIIIIFPQKIIAEHNNLDLKLTEVIKLVGTDISRYLNLMYEFFYLFTY